jgi:hypothetical protein
MTPIVLNANSQRARRGRTLAGIFCMGFLPRDAAPIPGRSV